MTTSDAYCRVYVKSYIGAYPDPDLFFQRDFLVLHITGDWTFVLQHFHGNSVRGDFVQGNYVMDLIPKYM